MKSRRLVTRHPQACPKALRDVLGFEKQLSDTTAARGTAQPAAGDFMLKAVRGHGRVIRARIRPLSQLGVAFSVIAFFMSFTPSLLPRPWDWQAWVTSATVSVTYATGVLLAWLAQRAGVRSVGSRTRRWIWSGEAVAVLVVVPLSLWLGARWQHDLRASLGMSLQFSYSYVGIIAIVAAVCLGALLVVRSIRNAAWFVGRRMQVWVRRVVASSIVIALVAFLVASFTTGHISHWIEAYAESSSAANDAGTDNGIGRPTSPFRSGSPGSLVPWHSLGRLGRTFVAEGPTAAQIEELSGRPAISPIRVYAGTASAGSPQAQADLVLAELKRTAAFDRQIIAIGVPPGEGGIENGLVAPLEYVFDGSTAIAAMQYSRLPSWVSFVADETHARDSARLLFDTVFGYWSTLPPARRPRLVVFGQSLGALGAADAFSGLSDLLSRTSGALYVGPPNATELWQQLTAQRVVRSPERLPLYGDGDTVRFAATPADLRAADGQLLRPRVVFLQHASDPVVWWSPALLWQPPKWLREPRGQAVPGAMQWFPVSTFMQLIGDLQKGLDPPYGYGHHYAPSEIATAWTALLHPQNWTGAEVSALTH